MDGCVCARVVPGVCNVVVYVRVCDMWVGVYVCACVCVYVRVVCECVCV